MVCAGLTGSTWPLTSQSKRWRSAASRCFTRCSRARNGASCSTVFRRQPFAISGTASTSTGRLMIAVLGGLADVERDLIRTRTAEDRSRARLGCDTSALVNRLRLPTQPRDQLVERRALRRVEVAMSGLTVTSCPASAALPDGRSSALACMACVIAKNPSMLRGERGRALRRCSKGDRLAWGRAKHRGNLRGRLVAGPNRRRDLR